MREFLVDDDAVDFGMREDVVDIVWVEAVVYADLDGTCIENRICITLN